MATLDVFNSDAFSLVSLTAAVESVPRLPTMLGQMGIFDPVPVRTESVQLESRAGTIGLVQSTPRGAPLPKRTTEKRKMRDARTVRIAKQDTITATEIQNIRAFGSETEMMQVQAEVARRLTGPAGIIRDIELTWENMRLGAIQGIVTDADGSTLNNWFDFWGETQPTEIDFDLDNASPASGALRKKCAQVVRQTADAMKMGGFNSWQVNAVMGRAFADDFYAHSEVRETYKNWTAAAELRTSAAFTTGFPFGGIVWHEYHGTDDNSTVAVGTDKAKFFPVGVPGLFQVAYSPLENIEMANTPGRDLYSMTVPDPSGRNFFVDVEAYSYPLFYCTRPLVLQRARRT